MIDDGVVDDQDERTVELLGEKDPDMSYGTPAGHSGDDYDVDEQDEGTAKTSRGEGV